MGKGEISRYEQFLLFPQCFQKACFPGASKGVIVWEWVNSLPNNKISAWSKLKAFADDKIVVVKKVISLLDRVENTVGKAENAGYQHFLLFPQDFPNPSSLGSLTLSTTSPGFYVSAEPREKRRNCS